MKEVEPGIAGRFDWWIRSGVLTLPLEMSVEPNPLPRLAPLQRVMLRDSLAAGNAGHHVEQVEIVFARGLAGGRVVSAWAETVARTEALRIAFLTGDGKPPSREFVEPRNLLNLEKTPPDSWQTWLDVDRLRPLLAPRAVPWRAVYWPRAGRFVWTFHHALLDGRSIARILRAFLERVAGREADDLAIAGWRAPPAEMLAAAEGMFRGAFANPEPVKLDLPCEPPAAGRAARCLGNDFATRLESMAAAADVSAAAVVTWAWGQALAQTSGAAAVMVEQLRSGAPQEGTAGFTMNTLPLLIRRAAAGGVEKSLRELRARLQALRAIESVSAADFPPGVFPDMDRSSSGVIMVERGTLRHLAGEVANGELVESLVLHESRGESLMATAHVVPDLRLEVEGPGRHFLLDAWTGVLEAGLSWGSHGVAT